MFNPIVLAATRIFRSQGLTTLRFDFSVPERVGRGDEAGTEDLHELLEHNTLELLEAVSALRKHAGEGASIVFAGYSWGALVCLDAARKAPHAARALALIAPPLDHMPRTLHPGRGDFARWPMLFVAGDVDEHCSAEQLQRAVGGSATTVVSMPNIGHFLEGPTAEKAARHVASWVAALQLQ
jgi:alpha/beta superfamily hydrolase